MKHPVVQLILISLLVKFAYMIFANFASPHYDHSVSYSKYIGLLKRGDTYWYEKIAQNGYREIREKKEIGYSKGKEYRQSEWAFFPFYPMVNMALMKATGWDFTSSAGIWSLFFSTFSFLGFFLFLRDYFSNQSRAFYCTILLMTLPFHYYFSMMYTEAVFFSFLIWSFWAIHQQKYLLLSLFLIPLVLVRPNGIITLVPLYLFYLEREKLIEGLRFKWSSIFASPNLLRSLWFLSGPLAFLGYCVFQYSKTGYFFAFSIAQAGWYREFMFPLLSFFRRGDIATQFNSVYAILVIIVSFLLRKKFTLSFNVFIWLSLLLPLCSGSVTSIQRFITVIFPLTIFVGTALYKNKWKYVWVGLFFLLQLVTFYWWVIEHKFSY